MKNSNDKLNAYTITWAIITPVKGKFFKKDLNVISKKIHSIGLSSNIGKAHFQNKEKAIEQVNKISGLSKDFKVTFITDKQFGMSKLNQNPLELATSKQLEETIIIK